MEAKQDMEFWNNFASQYSQDDSNRLFKESDFVFMEEPKPRPKRQLRSLDDDWEA